VLIFLSTHWQTNFITMKLKYDLEELFAENTVALSFFIWGKKYIHIFMYTRPAGWKWQNGAVYVICQGIKNAWSNLKSHANTEEKASTSPAEQRTSSREIRFKMKRSTSHTLYKRINIKSKCTKIRQRINNLLVRPHFIYLTESRGLFRPLNYIFMPTDE